MSGFCGTRGDVRAFSACPETNLWEDANMTMKYLLMVIALMSFGTASVKAGTQCPDGSYVAGDRCVLTANGAYASNGGPVGLAPSSAFPVGRFPPSNVLAPQPHASLCPNGQYVVGTCHLNPDGTYSGGK